jgi:RND family efflux transporter MFP subunit
MNSDAERPAVSRRGLRTGSLLIVVAAAVVVGLGISSRRNADASLESWTHDQVAPFVIVARPDTRAKTAKLTLPGRLEAFTQAQLFARVSGYVKDWKVDIGARVKAGQLLADIDAPDLDQQIVQGQADFQNSKANAGLSRLTLQRGNALIGSGAISKMALDQAAADYNSKLAQMASSQANLDRLRVLESYKRIVAPFDGLVTARATDIGTLINAGAGGGALYTISDTSKLRVYVEVPQNEAPSVVLGGKALVWPTEFPGKSYPATVDASTRSVDIASGETRVQLVVENANGDLMTGAYATVTLDLAHPDSSVTVPASALIFDQSGLRVATVGPDDRVQMKTITISRDFGQEIEVGSGLSAADRVVQSPPDGLENGDLVRVQGDPNAHVASEGAAAGLAAKPE